MRRATSLEFADFRESWYRSICRVQNAANPDYPLSVRELKDNDRVVLKHGYLLRRVVARERATGRLVGYAEVSERVHTFEKGTLNVGVEVDPLYQESDAWMELYDRAERLAASRGARALKTMASDADPAELERWRSRGFAEVSRDVESRLDLSKVDGAELRRRTESTAVEGIAFSTLAREKRRNPDHAEEIHLMEDDAGRDVPRTDRWRRVGPDEFVDLVLRSPEVIPSAWFVAIDRGAYVGESYLRRYSRSFPRSVTQGFTCTRRDHRGMGIARHLKLLCMLWAKERGVGQIMTWNDAANAPMLTLNRSLGFQRHATEFKLKKAIA